MRPRAPRLGGINRDKLSVPPFMDTGLGTDQDATCFVALQHMGRGPPFSPAISQPRGPGRVDDPDSPLPGDPHAPLVVLEEIANFPDLDCRPCCDLRHLAVRQAPHTGVFCGQPKRRPVAEGECCNMERYRSPTTWGLMACLSTSITSAGRWHCRRIT